MIKLINISPLNTSNEISYFCNRCGTKGYYKLESPMNTDNNGNPLIPLDFECAKCGNELD